MKALHLSISQKTFSFLNFTSSVVSALCPLCRADYQRVCLRQTFNVDLTSPDLSRLSAVWVKWEPVLKPLRIPFFLISPESPERNAVNNKNS